MAWGIRLVSWGQLFCLCPLPYPCALPASLLQGCTRNWKLFCSVRHCSAITKTFLCYQHYSYPKSKSQHLMNLYEENYHDEVHLQLSCRHTFRYCKAATRSLWSLLFSRLNKPNSPIPSSSPLITASSGHTPTGPWPSAIVYPRAECSTCSCWVICLFLLKKQTNKQQQQQKTTTKTIKKKNQRKTNHTIFKYFFLVQYGTGTVQCFFYWNFRTWPLPGR